MKWLSLFILCVAASCGYHTSDRNLSRIRSISVPYVGGDVDGQFTDHLAYALAACGRFNYEQSGGRYQLNVNILSNQDHRIGYRYDRQGKKGKKLKNIVGTEQRKSITVEVKLMDSCTEELIFGPELVTSTAEYDYIDGNSIKDLIFDTTEEEINNNKIKNKKVVINFSAGQLDSQDAASKDSLTPLYRNLAEKIVSGVLSHCSR